MVKIIGLLGLKGSGKDTVGQILEQHGYATVSFADSLKDCVSVIFGWDRQLMEGRTPESRLWREQNDPWWAERLGLPFFSPRLAMTTFGTDVMRNHFHNDIWIINTEKKIQQYDKVVLTDIRYGNEFALTGKYGGVSVRINRGEEPEWIPLAKRANRGDLIAIRELECLAVHESEWSLIEQKTDFVIDNNGTLGDLVDLTQNIISSDARRYS